MISLLGSSGAEALAQAGVKLGQKSAAALIQKVAAEVLKQINRTVGFRLIECRGG